MSAVAEKVLTTPQESQVAPANDMGAVLSIIERAARDPNVDIDKLERLMKMRDSMIERDAKQQFDAALSKMQPELPVIDRKGKIIIRDKNNRETIIQSTPYALWEDINEAIRPKLKEHGFALSFRTGLSEDGRVTVTGILSHACGHREETMMTLQHDATGSKNAVQAVGSSLSYGKRYAAMALLNITTRGEDDDGKAAGGDAPVSEDQVLKLRDLIEATGSNLKRFCGFFKIENMEDLPASRFDEAEKLLKAKVK